MAETSNISNFDFYLNFLSDDYGLHQVDELVGFDKINLLAESEQERYARDSFFGGDGEVKLTFGNNKGTKNLGYEFDKLIEYDNRFGINSNVEFIIKNRVTNENFVLGKLDFEGKETDQWSYFRCNIDQLQTQAEVKRFSETKVNLFSDTDLKGNPIDPVNTVNVLIPAKPKTQISEFEQGSESTGLLIIDVDGGGDQATLRVATNNAFNQIKTGIRSTISFFETSKGISSITGELASEGFTFLRAEQDLTNVNFKFSNILGNIIRTVNEEGTDINVLSADSGVRLVIKTGIDVDNIENTYTVWDFPITYQRIVDPLNETYDLPTDLEFNIDYIASGLKVYIYFEPYGTAIFDEPEPDPVDPVEYKLEINLITQSLEITTTSTAIDTVTKAVSEYDAYQQTVKSINQNFSVNAPRVENNLQFLATGDMIRGRETPFNLEWKDCSEYLLSEPNSDFQTVGNTIFIGHESDFYPNRELGAFLHKPDETFNITNNPRFTINGFEYKFKSYNQDKDDSNTIDAVHTEMELLVPNDNVQDIREVEVPFIRDHFLLSSTQEKAASENTSSVAEDDKVFIMDCVTIAPSTKGGFLRVLRHNVSGGNLRLLGEGFNWNVLGFVVGDTFTIQNTSNAGDYEVLEITNTILTLSPLGVVPTTIGAEVTRVSYPLTNVQYKLRTDEGFDQIDGVLNPNQYGNLRYTIKRSILNNWGSYLNTATSFTDDNIKVTYLKNNTELTTQFDGGVVINELADIEQSSLSEKIVTTNYITCKVICSFEDYENLKTNIEAITDNSIGGFIRVCDNNGRVIKGFPKKMDYLISEGVLELELEEKFESDVTNITFDGIYFIDEVGYPFEGTSQLDYNAVNDEIQFFDPNTMPLTNKLRYDKVSVNGVVYGTMLELKQAIENL